MSARAAQLRVASHPDRDAGSRGATAQQAAPAQGDARPNAGQQTAASLCQGASIQSRLGHLTLARQLAGQAIDRSASIPDQVDALIVAGSCAAVLDDLVAGEEYLQRAIDLSRQSGYRAGHSRALEYLASHVQLRRGQFDLALATAAEAARLGFAGPQPSILVLHAWVYQITGERERAHAALEALDGIADRDQRIGAIARYLAAQLALDEGELARAWPLLCAALAVAQATGHPMLAVGVRIAISRWHRLNDDWAAREWATEAVATAQRLESRYLEGQALIARGQAAWHAGDLAAAAADLRLALAMLDERGAGFDAAHAALLRSALYQQAHCAEADDSWLDTARRIIAGGYGFLLERERRHALPLLAAHLRSEDAEARVAADTLLRGLQRVPPPPLRIVGLGDFAVHIGERRISPHAWEQRQAGRLFRFLLVQPRYSACRDVVAEALWPRKSPAAAERVLQQATWALRHILEPDLPDKFTSRYLTVADHCVILHVPPGSTVDFIQFERAISGAFTAARDELEQALALYTGALFPLDRYADWSAGAREHLAELALRGLLYLARQYMEGQRPQQALGCCDRIAAEDHWNEEATKLAMLACLAMGDRVGALRRYEALKHALRRDLRLAPRADLRELAEAIRGEP